MVVGVGVDIIEIARIAAAVEHSERFVHRIYTPGEIAYCQQASPPFARLAGRFAAKEAVMKALESGWGPLAWQEIEVQKGPQGQPLVALSGAARELAQKRGVRRVLLSISHSRDYAVAYATAIG